MISNTELSPHLNSVIHSFIFMSSVQTTKHTTLSLLGTTNSLVWYTGTLNVLTSQSIRNPTPLPTPSTRVIFEAGVEMERELIEWGKLFISQLTKGYFRGQHCSPIFSWEGVVSRPSYLATKFPPANLTPSFPCRVGGMFHYLMFYSLSTNCHLLGRVSTSIEGFITLKQILLQLVYYSLLQIHSLYLVVLITASLNATRNLKYLEGLKVLGPCVLKVK